MQPRSHYGLTILTKLVNISLNTIQCLLGGFLTYLTHTRQVPHTHWIACQVL